MNLSFYQGRPNGGKNSGPTTLVNTCCSKRKKPSHSNSKISLPVTKSMEIKNYFPNKKFQNKKYALAGRIKEFLPALKLLTKDQLLTLVEGYQILLLTEPMQKKTPKVPRLNQKQQHKK